MRRIALVLVPTLALLVGSTAAITAFARSQPAEPAATTSSGPDRDTAAGATDAFTSDRSPATVDDAPACVTSESRARDISRVSGPDRYATATCAAAARYPDGTATAVLARGDAAGQYADALAGTVLAHAVGGPVLLTAPDDLPQTTADEIGRLGAEHVVLLGGTHAISDRVESQVEALGVTTERLDGNDRAHTAALVAARADAGPEAFVVNGHAPPDALVAGAVAARAGAALLLVDGDGVPDATADALASIERVTIVGGHGVVPTTVEELLRERIGDVRRLSGASREETAASVARALPSAGTVHVVNGSDTSLVDAIAAGWVAALPGGGPVLYVERAEPGRGTDRYLRLGGLAGLPSIQVFGGGAVVDPALIDELEIRLDEAEAGGPAPQTRAMWVHLFDDSLKSREGIARTLDTAAAHNLNTVIAQVVRRHDTYSTSDVLPRTSDEAMPADLDLLAELTTQAHARGLELHAWVVVGNTWNSDYGSPSDLPADHVYRQHGPGTSESWMTVGRVQHEDGTVEFVESRNYMDIGVPAFRDHVVAFTEEIAQRYPIDAVHLDYLRYPEGGHWGYNPIARQQWEADGSPDFADWRRARTEELAREIKQAVTAARPGTRVTMAAIAQGDGPAGMGGFENTRAYAHVYQDWAGWLARDVVDSAYPMAYMREEGVSSSCDEFSTCEHAAWYDHWVEFAASLAPDEDIAVGQAAFLNTVGHSLAQIGEALAGSDGVVLYSYQQDTKCPSDSSCRPVEPQGSLLAALLDGPFADPAPSR